MNRAACSLITASGLALPAWGQGAITFDREVWPLEGEGFTLPGAISLRDVDGDGLLDLVSEMWYRPNTGARSFGAALPLPEVEETLPEGCLATIDLDRDGDLDCFMGVVTTQPDRLDLRWRERLSEDEFAPESVYALPPATWIDGTPFPGLDFSSAMILDLDGDGENEILREVYTPYDDFANYGMFEYLEPAEMEEAVKSLGKVGFSAFDSFGVGVGPALTGNGAPSVYQDEYDFNGGGDGGATIRRYYAFTGEDFQQVGPSFIIGVDDPFDYATGGVFVTPAEGESARLATYVTDGNTGLRIRDGVVGSVRAFYTDESGVSSETIGEIVVDFGNAGFTPFEFTYISLEFAAQTRMGDLSSVGFDPDEDGDQDLLAEIAFSNSFSDRILRSVVLFNDGKGSYVGKVGPKVRDLGGSLGGPELIDRSLLGERWVGGFELPTLEVIDLDGDGLANEQYAGGTTSGLHVRTIRAWTSGDLNRDGVVGMNDLAIVVARYGDIDGEADLDGDGVVGARDVAIVLASWGARAE